MAFFKDIINDISNIGSLNTRYKKLVTQYLNMLQRYSYGEFDLSKEVTYSLALAKYQELEEVSFKFEFRNEYLKIYNPKGDIETTIEEAQIALKLCFEEVFIHNKKLSNTQTIVCFNRAKSWLN